MPKASDPFNTPYNNAETQLFPVMGFESATASEAFDYTGQLPNLKGDPFESSLDSPWGSQVTEESHVTFNNFLKNYGP